MHFAMKIQSEGCFEGVKNFFEGLKFCRIHSQVIVSVTTSNQWIDKHTQASLVSHAC